MKKVLIAVAIIVGLIAVKSYAADANQPWLVKNASMTAVSIGTISATPVEVAYITIGSTGTILPNNVYFINGTSTMVVVGLSTSAGTQTIDLSKVPVRFGTSLICHSTSGEPACFYTVVYRKLIGH